MRRGWCPTVFAPMPTGDGLLARLRPPLCRITAAQARAVAQASARLGNGIVEVTSRAALQLRGLDAAGAETLAELACDLGLADPDPAAERRRCVVTAPLAGPAASRLALALGAALAADAALATLPAKFCVAVENGDLPLGALGADIRVVAGVEPCRLSLDGAALEAACPAETAVAAVQALARAFLVLGGGAGRMRDLPAARVFAAAGLSPVAAPLPDAPARPVGRPIGLGAGGFVLAPAFGALEAGGLHALADLADGFADGLLRLAPWRAVVLAGVDPAHREAVAARARAAGLIADPADPRLAVVSCPGAPRCAAAEAPAREDAAALAGALRGGTLHVSGCAKGCAHPRAAAAVLVGRGGLYDVVWNGRAEDAPALRGLTLAVARTVLESRAG